MKIRTFKEFCTKDDTTSVVNEGKDRPIYKIAAEVKADWKKVYFGAVPYLDAMFSLEKITDDFFQDSGSSVVAYFLANAQTWRGETAKRVKKELNAMLKASYK